MKKILLFLITLTLTFALSACTPKFHSNEDYNELLEGLFAIFTEEKLLELETEKRINYEVTGALWWCVEAQEDSLPLISCYVDFLVEFDAIYINPTDPPRYAGFIRVGDVKIGDTILSEDYQLVLSTIYGNTRRANMNAFREVHEAHKSLNVATGLYEGTALNRRLP